MIRSLKLIFLSSSEWEKMSLKPPHPLTVFFVSLLPLIVAMLAIEAWGLTRFGYAHGEIGVIQVPAARAIKYVAFYGAASIAVILMGAALLRNVAPSFNLQSTFGSCFVIMAYGYSPVFLLRVADAVPAINTWICWGISMMLALRILYHGVAHWLKPEQTKGLGVFLVSVIYVVVLSGLVHFASTQVLQGRLLKHLNFGPAVENPAAAR